MNWIYKQYLLLKFKLACMRMTRLFVEGLENGDVRELNEIARAMRLIAQEQGLPQFASLADTIENNAERIVLERKS